MNLSQLYSVMGWPLRFWRTETLPPQPVAHDIPFSEAMRISRDPEETSRKRALENEEFLERRRAMDARYSSLKQGENLEKLTTEERQELLGMETGHGWCLNLATMRPPERLGQRRACFFKKS